jgi:hypothetical protein
MINAKADAGRGMPPSVSVPLAAAFCGLFVLAMGTPAAKCPPRDSLRAASE